MTQLSTEDCTAAIADYSRAFADAARGNLATRVRHCPDWDVAALVRHLTDVHWMWATIAEGTLRQPPDEALRPGHPPDDALVDAFESGSRHLVDVLAAADQSAACWTWFPGRQDVGFITRHQVQEAAVHAWDAVDAAGGDLAVSATVAADSVDEFLTCSLADEEDARRVELTPLDGAFALRAADTGDTWTVSDGGVPGSVRMRRGRADGAAQLDAPAADLLLWLYGRRSLTTDPVPDDLLERFRRLTSTD